MAESDPGFGVNSQPAGEQAGSTGGMKPQAAANGVDDGPSGEQSIGTVSTVSAAAASSRRFHRRQVRSSPRACTPYFAAFAATAANPGGAEPSALSVRTSASQPGQSIHREIWPEATSW